MHEPADGGSSEPRVPVAEVEAGEPITRAAARGARELTGLMGLGGGNWFGRRDHTFSQGESGAERWDFVWFEARDGTPDTWIHEVQGRRGERASRVRVKFMPFESARIESPMAALVPRLRERISCADVAVCYITRGREILVFAGHPGGGVQVAAGRVEPGEAPEQAATREAYEEAGLRLAVGQFVGTQEWHHRGRADVHEFRHYYWFRAPATAPDAWQHRVSAGDADAGRIFHHRFVPAAGAHLDWDLDAYVPALLDRLA